MTKKTLKERSRSREKGSPAGDRQPVCGDGNKALRLMSAARYQAEVAKDTGDLILKREAQRMEKEAQQELATGVLKKLSGNEIVPVEKDSADGALLCFRETLDRPSSVNVKASTQRMTLAVELNCLAMAADAADTIDAKNSLEKMLVHQMVACHKLSMDFLAEAQGCIGRRSDITVKLVNTSARLMDTYQRHLTALAKIRGGGQQVVTVHHVNVNEGGQAIVGNVGAGGSQPEGGKGQKRG